MKTLERLILAAVILAAPACAKTAADKPHAAGSDTAKARPANDDDHIVVLAKHTPSKPTDPVVVRFDKFKVVSATFDPDKIEGGQATIELDLSSLRTDSRERDDDLRSPKFIDVGNFATATIDIANVKTKTGKTFSADATVKLRGMTKTYPVTFDVIAQDGDSIRIKGEYTFSRLDFSVGSDPAKDSQQQVDTELTIQMVLTLRKS